MNLPKEWSCERKLLVKMACDRSLLPYGVRMRLFYGYPLDDRSKTLVLDYLEAAKNDWQRHWETFYQTNETRFYKDRHWLTREWPELAANKIESKQACSSSSSCGSSSRSTAANKTESKQAFSSSSSSFRYVLDCGCGVGNAMFPLLESGDDDLHYYCFDLSSTAIQFIRDSDAFDARRCTPFMYDVSRDALPKHIVEPASCQFALLIFVLGAVPPDLMLPALKNIADAMAPGGLLMFRDHAHQDHAQHRFDEASHTARLAEQWYARGDSTTVFFFDLDTARQHFADAGFETVRLDIAERDLVNRRNNINLPASRRFIHGLFRKLQ
jgi:SAM-dependent methyltransferase